MSLVTQATVVPPQRGDAGPLVDGLPETLRGIVHLPGTAAYDAHVTPWMLAVPMQPAAVVAARTARDVVAAVRLAADRRWTVGVQATGHGAVSSLAGHLLVSTKGLDEVTVHPDGWARVGAGVKWLRVIEAAAPLGLAPLNGSTSDVGVVGYTTGGGVGPLARTHGLAADRVRAFDVVTGDGVLRRVTPTEHPDLFYALRGGKGTAGIVTAVEFDLLPLRAFYGGAVYFDGADAAAVVDRWRRWSEQLPEQGTTSFALFRMPAMPGVPPQLSGRLSVAVRLVWTGEPDDGARFLDEMRTAAPVLLDDAAVKPYTAVDSVHADPVDPMPAIDPALLLTDFPAEAATRLLDVTGPGSASTLPMVEVRQLGGAYAREGQHPAAFDHRAARYSVLVIGMADDPGAHPRAAALFASLAAWDTGGIWPNFGPAHDAATARRAYAPATLERLAAVSRRYDPQGVLQAGSAVRDALG